MSEKKTITLPGKWIERGSILLPADEEAIRYSRGNFIPKSPDTNYNVVANMMITWGKTFGGEVMGRQIASPWYDNFDNRRSHR